MVELLDGVGAVRQQGRAGPTLNPGGWPGHVRADEREISPFRRRSGAELQARRDLLAHLPATLDLSAVVRPAWVEYAAWVVSAIVIRRFIDRDSDEETFVPLASTYLGKYLPRNICRPLLDALLGAGVLETDGTYYFRPYNPGGRGKSRCYRLGPAYRGQPVVAVRLSHPELLRKAQKAYAQERAEVVDSVHLSLRAWHDRVEVVPDAPYGLHPLLDVLIDGERRFSVCAQGRVHTNIANLPAHFRHYIRLCGHELLVR